MSNLVSDAAHGRTGSCSDREDGLRELAGPDEVNDLLDIRVHPPVAIQERHARAHELVCRPGFRARLLYTSQVECLADGEEVYSRDVLRELDDGSGIAGGYGAHAHLVLVVRLGGAGEDAHRAGELERLGRHRRAAELHPLCTRPLAASKRGLSSEALISTSTQRLIHSSVSRRAPFTCGA